MLSGLPDALDVNGPLVGSCTRLTGGGISGGIAFYPFKGYLGYIISSFRSLCIYTARTHGILYAVHFTRCALNWAFVPSIFLPFKAIATPTFGYGYDA